MGWGGVRCCWSETSGRLTTDHRSQGLTLATHVWPASNTGMSNTWGWKMPGIPQVWMKVKG